MSTELKVTKEAVLAAAAKCETAKATLKVLFPEVFNNTEHEMAMHKLKQFINNEGNFTGAFPFEWYQALPGGSEYEKARLLFENYIKPGL